MHCSNSVSALFLSKQVTFRACTGKQEYRPIAMRPVSYVIIVSKFIWKIPRGNYGGDKTSIVKTQKEPTILISGWRIILTSLRGAGDRWGAEEAGCPFFH